jgi:hypothetical protein
MAGSNETILARYRITSPDVKRLLDEYVKILSRERGFQVPHNHALMGHLNATLPAAIAAAKSRVQAANRVAPQTEEPGDIVEEVFTAPIVSVDSVLKGVALEDWE